MLSEVKNNYRSVFKHFSIQSPSFKKEELIELAKSGSKKPLKDSVLGRALRSYTYIEAKPYDPKFNKLIRKLRPDWFPKFKETSNKNKKEIIRLARKGADRPNQKKSHLGRALTNYTNKTSSTYDSKFAQLIKKLRPDWFESPQKITIQKKKEILKIAKSGQDRPNQKKHPLGRDICRYTQKSCKLYDPKFDKFIRKLRPDWFVSRSEKASQNKREILKIAKSGGVKPTAKTIDLLNIKFEVMKSNLRSTYVNSVYAGSNQYDRKFRSKLERTRPDWFLTSKDKKKKIIWMAKTNMEKPNRNTKLGQSFCSYVRKDHGAYDPEFHALIKKLRPDWFITVQQKVEQNKKQIIELVKQRKTKKYIKKKFGVVLSNYTNHKNSSYDPIFTKKIKNLRPDLLITPSQTVETNKKQIIKIAKNGEDRPSIKTKMGIALNNYIARCNRNKHFEFYKFIRKLRPDWFRNVA